MTDMSRLVGIDVRVFHDDLSGVFRFRGSAELLPRNALHQRDRKCSPVEMEIEIAAPRHIDLPDPRNRSRVRCEFFCDFDRGAPDLPGQIESDGKRQFAQFDLGRNSEIQGVVLDLVPLGNPFQKGFFQISCKCK